MSGLERAFQRCPECGAQCGPTAQRCWMCNASLSSDMKRPSRPRARPSEADKEFAREKPRTDSTTEVLLLLAALIIGAGLWVASPGYAILFVLVVVPALLAMFLSVERKIHPDSEFTLLESIVEHLFKLLRGVAILVLVLFGIVIAAGVFCFIVIAGNSIRIR
jgi:hypothetical protein